MGCAGGPAGDGGSTKPDKAAACSAPDRPKVNGRRIASGIVIIAAMAAHGRFPQLCASSPSLANLITDIFAREYDTLSHDRPDPRFFFASDILMMTSFGGNPS